MGKTWESSRNGKEDLEWTGTGEQGVTYITRYGEINMVSYQRLHLMYVDILIVLGNGKED